MAHIYRSRGLSMLGWGDCSAGWSDHYLACLSVAAMHVDRKCPPVSAAAVFIRRRLAVAGVVFRRRALSGGLGDQANDLGKMKSYPTEKNVHVVCVLWEHKLRLNAMQCS